MNLKIFNIDKCININKDLFNLQKSQDNIFYSLRRGGLVY